MKKERYREGPSYIMLGEYQYMEAHKGNSNLRMAT